MFYPGNNEKKVGKRTFMAKNYVKNSMVWGSIRSIWKSQIYFLLEMNNLNNL